MEMIPRFFKRFGTLLRRNRFNSELDEEMAFHREQKEKELREFGVAPEAAHRAAVREFGNTTRLKEQSYEVVGFRFETVWQDLHFAIRQLRRSPGFTLTAIVMLALGIGASVAIFAFVDTALIKPLPYKDPTTLADVAESGKAFRRSNLSYQDFADWKKMNKVFSALEAYTGTGSLIDTPSGVEPVPGARVTAGFFRVLGVTPALGRDFYDGEDKPGAADTVMITYQSWQSRFGGRPDVVGQTVKLDGTPNTIIAVLPATFQFAPRGNAEFWKTMHELNNCEKRRSCHNLFAVGRLKDGVTVAMARTEMLSIAKLLENQYPDSNRGQGATVQPLYEQIVGNIRPILLVLLGGAALLLAIACVNVSSLLLVRSESRRREIAVRGALGASPSRLTRQFITEALVLVLSGGLLGLSFAYCGMHVLLKLISKDAMAYVPYLAGVNLNARVLTFTGGICMLAAVLFAMTPVLRLSLTALRDGLNDGGRGAAGVLWRRIGANLVVVELAIAVVLLVGAGLLGKSFYKMLHVDFGFQPDHLATAQVVLPETSYAKGPQAVAVTRRILGDVAALPGVKSASFANQLPVSGNGNTDWIRIVGKPYNGEHNEVNGREVSADYFKTLQAKLIAGRFFAEDEDASKPLVIVINKVFAKQYFPGEDPVGRKIGDTSLTPTSLREIVGVVDDVKEGGLDEAVWPAEYRPLNQNNDSYLGLVVRTTQDEKLVLPALGTAIHKIDPGIGVVGEATMIGRINESQTAYLHRSAAWLVGGFAVLALLLGVVGLYGVVAYSVSQRTREIGVRMALGAQQSSVYRMILKEAGWLTGIGIGAGLICAVAVAALMRGLLFGIRSWDVPTLGLVAVVLGAASLLASYFPARRAASVNPVEALRAE
ncbi:MAG TPA: ABC transporter permease [Edaphobacter sp.]|jgi:macrolide transport system ATP-binding/permease protein|nr:ABC transporter permease [Edaphobacter sp.]